MEAKKYRAVDSNGREFEVELRKTSKPTDVVSYARAPNANGQPTTQSRPEAFQGGVQ